MKPTASEFSAKTWWEGWLERMQAHYVSLILCSIGGILMWGNPPGGFWHSLGEAWLIAGLLVLFVDPMLKGRLLREASRGIFHYLLGYDQQPEIKERLRELVFNTKVFRKDLKVKCTFVPKVDSMLLEIESEFEIINPTNEAIEFQHKIQVERVEKPVLHALTLLSSQENYTLTPNLENKKDDPIVLEGSGKKVSLQPLSKGIQYHFGAKFSMTYPQEFFYAVHVGVPTIGLIVEVVPPEGYVVTCFPTPIQTKNLWKYDKLFMPGEHVDIRWQRQTSGG